MRAAAIAAAALLAFEGAALACSCLATDDPAELERFAAEAAVDAVALVEAEALTTFQQTRAGERLRVLRVLAASAPSEFIVERGPNSSSASCDVLYEVGNRALVILYPSPGPPATYRTSGLCSVHLLDKPVYRNARIKALGGAPSLGERG